MLISQKRNRGKGKDKKKKKTKTPLRDEPRLDVMTAFFNPAKENSGLNGWYKVHGMICEQRATTSHGELEGGGPARTSPG
jgi:hypothetical protein